MQESWRGEQGFEYFLPGFEGLNISCLGRGFRVNLSSDLTRAETEVQLLVLPRGLTNEVPSSNRDAQKKALSLSTELWTPSSRAGALPASQVPSCIGFSRWAGK